MGKDGTISYLDLKIFKILNSYSWAQAVEKFLPKPDLYIGYNTWANLCFTVQGCKSHAASSFGATKSMNTWEQFSEIQCCTLWKIRQY